jgi:hypothetical protein
MLYRPLYRGEIVWNRSQRIVKAGIKKQRKRDVAEWITIPAPALQIISDELSKSIKARLEERAILFPRVGKKLAGRPRFKDESAYLLVGFARCGVCGGPVGTDLCAHGSNGSRHHIRHYACLDHKRGGNAICINPVSLRRDVLDRVILAEISEALRPEVLARAVDKALGS